MGIENDHVNMYRSMYVSTTYHNNRVEDTIYLHMVVVRLGDFTNLLDPWWNATFNSV